MNKRDFKIKFKHVLIFIFAMVIFVIIGVTYNQSVMSKWQPTNDIVGTWSGKAAVNMALLTGSTNAYKSKDMIDIDITILKDGTVTGTVGDAKIVGCRISLNRNDFERYIKVKTDYIIKDGYLDGAINSKDILDYRDISMPFNIDNGMLNGSIFHVHRGKYPDPLFVHIELKQQ